MYVQLLWSWNWHCSRAINDGMLITNSSDEPDSDSVHFSSARRGSDKFLDRSNCVHNYEVDSTDLLFVSLINFIPIGSLYRLVRRNVPVPCGGSSSWHLLDHSIDITGYRDSQAKIDSPGMRLHTHW